MTGAMLGLRIDDAAGVLPAALRDDRPTKSGGRVLRLTAAQGPLPEATERWRSSDDGPALVVAECHDGSWLLTLSGAGAAWLASDGRDVQLTAEGDGLEATFSRFVVAQVLSFAAVLHGLEVLHASAVVLDGAAVAITAPSGTGKSTLALHLLAAGARPLTDDALALELIGGKVIAHPGPPVISVPDDASDVAEAFTGARLWRDRGKDRRALTDVWTTPVPLRALVVLDRGSSDVIEVDESPMAPASVFGATTNAVVQSPKRLTSLLELHSRLTRDVRMLRVRTPEHVAGQALTDAVLKTLASRR